MVRDDGRFTKMRCERGSKQEGRRWGKHFMYLLKAFNQGLQNKGHTLEIHREDDVRRGKVGQ
jgi:hypothetical protein